MHAILQWPLGISVAAIAALSVVLSGLTVYLLRRARPQGLVAGNNELVGFSYSVFGVIYGVLLAFTIIVAWERFEETETLVLSETTLLSELWRNAVAFDAKDHEEIQRALMAYAQSVIDDEWPSMALHGQPDSNTEEIYGRLWALTYAIEPKTGRQAAFLGEHLARLNELSGARRLRILHGRMGVHQVLWVVLLIGAFPAVGYTLLFSTKHAWVQASVMGSIMLMVLLCLLVTFTLQHPFSGAAGIKPDAFVDLLESFRNRLLIESGRVGP